MFSDRAFQVIAVVFLQFPLCGIAQEAKTIAADMPEVVLQVPHATEITAIAVSRDGKHYATASADATIEMWDAGTGLMERVLKGHQGSVTDVCFSPDSRSILSGSADGTLRVWDVATGAPVQRLQAGGPVGRVLWSPDRKQIAATTDKTALTWDTASWSTTQLPAPALGLTLGVGAYSSDSRTLVFGGGFNEIGFVDAYSGARTPDARFPGALRAEPNGRYSAGAFNRQVGVWDGQAMKPIKLLTVDENAVTVASVSPDGQLVAATGDHADVAVWNVASGKEIFRWEGKSRLGAPSRIEAVAFSMDSKTLFTGDDNGQLQQFQINSGAVLQRSHAPLDRMVRADYTADGTMVIASSNEAFSWTPDGTISSFGMERKESWLCPWAPNYGIRPGSNELTYCDAQGVSGIDLQTGQTTSYGRQIQSAALAWSERGDYLAAAASYNGVIACSHIVLYHLVGETREVRDLPLSSCTQAAVFTPDEDTLILGTSSYTGPELQVSGTRPAQPPNAVLQYVDVVSGKLTRTVPVPDQSVVSLAQTPDGTKVAALLSNGTVLLLNDQGIELHRWRLPNATTRPNWAGHAISFTHRGDVLAVTNGDVISMLAVSPPYAEARSLQVGASVFPHAVSFSPGDDRLLVSGDNSAIVWSLRDAAAVVRIYLSAKGGYFAVTPEGYYMSYDAGDLVAFRYRDHIYPFDEFDVRYNRPDKVLQEVGLASDDAVHAYEVAWLKRLIHLGLTEASASAPLEDAPRVSANVVNSSADTVQLQISATSTRAPLRKLLVSVNGSPLRLSGTSRPPGQDDLRWDTRVSIPLSPGDNVIHVSVQDAAGNASLRQTLRTYSVQPRARPRLFALLVGISKYQQSSFNLTYADHDAEMLSRFLQRQNGEYSQIEVTALLNEQATHANILAAAKQLAAARQDDHVIIVLSGHGILDENGDYYFASHDVDFTHPQSNGITYAELDSALSGLASRDKLLLIDSCHAGEIDNLPTFSSENATSKPDPRVQPQGTKGFGLEPVASYSTASRLMEALFTDLKTGTGTSIIAASAGDEVAFESDQWHNGVFTYALIRGISEGTADENGDGVITVEELRRYIAGEVRKLTGGVQQPSTRADNSWNDFVVTMPDRLLRSFALSGTQVTSASFSPKGGRILASSSYGLLRVWDVDSGSLLSTQEITSVSPIAAFTSEDTYRSLESNSLLEFTLPGGSKTIRPFSFGTPPLPLESPRAFDATTGMAAGHMFGGGSGEKAAVVDVLGGTTGTVVSQWPSPLNRPYGFKSYALSRDDKLVVEGDSRAGSTESSVQLRMASTGKLLQVLTPDDIVLSLKFSPDGKWLAAGCSGNHVIVWDLEHGSKPHSLGADKNSENGIFALSFSPDSKRLAAGSSTGVAQVWNLDSFALADTIFNRDVINDVSFDPAGKVLAIGGQSGYVRLWDLSVSAFQ